MKKITNFILTSFISLLISFFMFSLVMLYLFIPKNSNHLQVDKTESLVSYSYPGTIKDFTILLSINNCPQKFLIKVVGKSQNISVSHTDSEDFFDKEKSLRRITFDTTGFENVVNYLGGVEIETPYGLPSPAKTKKIIAKDKSLLVFGASLGEILTSEAAPTKERKSYYSYIIKELTLKFFSDCTTESYKFLKQNCKTDISYTDFYDNYKSLKNIKR